MSQIIELSMGMIALVDDCDFERASRFSWYMSSNGYARRTLPGGRAVTLHRFLLEPGVRQDVDHLNGDRLDCRRGNMRACSRAENRRNHWYLWPNASQFVGVYRRIVRPGWFVFFAHGPRQSYCGDYQSEEEAARAYDAVARYYLGARTNFPGDRRANERELLVANGQCKPKQSAYRGVHRSAGKSRRWASSLHLHGANHRLGHFDTELEAAKAYDAAVHAMLGENGRDRLNFPELLAG